MITLRDRSQIDDRHMIRDPILIDPRTQCVDLMNAAAWTNTLAKTRIPQLFMTQAGLAGHVQQLQNELNRVTMRKLTYRTDEGIEVLTMQIKFVRESIRKSMAEARRQGFQMPNNLVLEFPFISDRLTI